MNTDDTPDAETDTASSGPSKERLGPGSPSSSVFTRGVRQLLVIKEELSSEWSPNLDQEDRGYIHIKEEQEELWTSQEGQQLNELEGADSTRLSFTTVTVKSEDDEEKPQTSLLHQSLTEDTRQAEPPASSSATRIKTEIDGEDCGGSEPARNQDAGSHPQQNTSDEASDCSETEVSYGWQEPLSNSGPETEDSDSDWKRNRAPDSGVNALKYKDAAPVSDVGCNTEKKSVSCFKFGKGFHCKSSLQRHMMCDFGKRSSSCLNINKFVGVKEKADSKIRAQTGEKLFGCVDCGTRFSLKKNLERHMRVHTGEKPFGCDVCGKRCTQQGDLKTHMRVHTGEKPFGCDVCGKRFTQQGDLKAHVRVHTGEKLVGCDVCGKRFTEQGSLRRHVRIHTGDKPFGCSVCGKRFNQQTHFKTHMRIHTGEKPFSCDVCGTRFVEQSSLKKHMRVHTGEKPFGCDVCGKRFTQQGNVKKHMKVHLV